MLILILQTLVLAPICTCVFSLLLFDADLFFLCRFDLILDTVGGDTPHYSLDLLKTWRNSKYVSIVSPLLSNTDSLGVPGGLLKSIGSLGSHLLKVNRCNVY